MQGDEHEMHTLVDASIRSLAAAVYMCTFNSPLEIKSSLLMARQKLSPLKDKTTNLTIPRLELTVLLIGIRLTAFILKEISILVKTIRIYSDSQAVLHWIQTGDKNGTFVGNRCKEIRNKLQNGKIREFAQNFIT
ncbi:hypothetical protein ANCCAN_06200 [Ancylostoma caninum]|uniref:RNase H type-1 domain-containing protein n=1 Tax=Ancylostoma caninum TaxID=29170 RepID=A0A368GTM5_ANCCA|nr:hypothetical protein ANCCAN_06200 [Ancylostoma caninum]